MGVFRKTPPRQDHALLMMVQQGRFVSARALTARRRKLYGMRAGQKKISNWLLSHGYCAYRPTNQPLLTAKHRHICLEWANRWQNLTMAQWQHSSSVTSPDCNFVPFARQYLGNNYRYQDDTATPHHVSVVISFLQQSNITKMEQPARSADCTHTEYIWDELGHATTSMDNPPQKLGELCQALLAECAEIRVERLQQFVASIPLHLPAIIAARGGDNRCWPSMHKTTPTGSIIKKSSLFDKIYHNYPPMTLEYVHVANVSIMNKCYHKFTKIHIKEYSAYKTSKSHKSCQPAWL